MKFPNKTYSVIYADPPWSYHQCGTGPKSRGNAAQHYHTIMYLPYKLDAASVKGALHEARMCATTFYPRFRETEKPDVEVIRK